MSLLVVGLSHRSASVPMLERTALAAELLPDALAALAATAEVRESVLVSTCNRLEVYAEVTTFHAGLTDVTQTLSRLTGVAHDELVPALYVHYEDKAVQHLFTVACGLDSMVLGEAQILGQLRTSYGVATAAGTTASQLHELFQQALRVGKRAHSETGLDAAGASLVSVGLDAGEHALGSLDGADVLIVGAGSMGALAGTTLRRRGARTITVANRTPANAERLAASLDGRGTGLTDLVGEIAAVDVLVTSTGSVGTVIELPTVERAMAKRPDRPLLVLDLAMPRDTDPQVRVLRGVTVVDLETLSDTLARAQVGVEVAAARQIVLDEVSAFLSWRRSQTVGPTVTAIRTAAAQVVRSELDRLEARVPDLDVLARAEVETTIRRVVDKLLHTPTVRVKELAAGPDGERYAQVMRELFDLGREPADAVARVDLQVDDQLATQPGELS